MKTIIWNDLAIRDYHENIDYLLNRWSEKEAITFINDVESVIFNLKQGRVEFKESGYLNIKQCIVCKQVTLYYKHIESHTIELLRFWNNFQDTNKLKL
jgi:plasmid stabilization system protein ParE